MRSARTHDALARVLDRVTQRSRNDLDLSPGGVVDIGGDEQSLHLDRT